MSPKKKNKKHGGDFRNEPFRNLKGITTRSPAASSQPPPRASSQKEEDGEQLFLRAAEGAIRIGLSDDEGAGPSPDRTSAAGAPVPVVDGEEGLFQEAISTLGASSFGEQRRGVDEEDADSRRSASSRMRQLKRGTIRIAEELDLHGHVRDEAIRRLEHFIGSAYARSLGAVLVITGKGLNSPDGPVLQGAVREWLRTAGSRMVAEFHAGPRDKGGSGAYVVFLRRRT